MKRRSHAKRRDGNEPEIVAALKEMGATVISLDEFDLLVGYGGADTKLEIKNPDTDWQVKPAQRDLYNNWDGAPIHIVTNARNACHIVKRNALK